MANTGPTQLSAGQSPAANGLAIVRVTIGAMLVWVFFENLGKGLYTPAGYAGLINYYIKARGKLLHPGPRGADCGYGQAPV